MRAAPRRHLFAAAIAVAAATALAPGAASAQGRPSAETLFKEGRAAANRSDWAQACTKFEESQKLDPAPGTLANLATCEEKQGHLLRSSEYARQAVTELPAGDARRDVVKKLLADLDKRTPKLTIKLAAGAPSDAKVSLDGKELDKASLGTPVPVDPGEHSISVTAAGRAAQPTDVTLAEGASKELVVEPGAADDAGAAGAVAPRSKSKREASAAAAPPAAGDVPPEPSTSPVRIAGFVIGGLGLASIAVGGITGGMVFGKKKTVDEHCNADKACDQQGVDAGSSGTTLATVSTITFAAGAGALAGGVLLVLLGRPEARVTVGPTASSAGAGLAVGGKF